MCAESLLRPLRAARLGAPTSALICFSHLRWSFVWQRPQHILSRFAADRPVYVIEEPQFVYDLARARLNVERDGDVTILTPELSATSPEPLGFNDTTNPQVSQLLTEFFDQRGLLSRSAEVTTWYYTPMALGAEPRGLEPTCVVFDVMDELANFRGAPEELRSREQSLFNRADIVFTGGPSLHQLRRGRHANLHCFPSGVDVRHFAQARTPIMPPDDATGLGGNVIGFYGVLDERLDLDLIAAVADRRPDWNMLLIGPVVKIAVDDLPRRANIHYLGKRDYRELPAYLSMFDAAILPFARNEATQFISPTKTLEYLAANKPVVSTSIKDVIDLYGSVVAFGDTPETFVSAIESLWTEPMTARRSRRIRARRLLAEHSWDVIAGNMRRLVDDIVVKHSRFTLLPVHHSWAPANLESLQVGASS